MAAATQQRKSEGSEQDQLPLPVSSTQSGNRGIDESGREALQGGIGSINEIQLARGLGAFSIALGLAEVLAPKTMARIIGVRDDSKTNITTIQALGAREIAHGIGIFSQRNPLEAVWTRVGGDLIDLACLGVAFSSSETDKARLAFATANVLGVAALDLICAQQLARNYGKTAQTGAVHVQKTITIYRPAEEIYNFWRDFSNLPEFMFHLQSVEVLDGNRSRWTAKAPTGAISWEAETTEDVPNERISWRSLPGSAVANAGTVSFVRATGDRGTVVSVDIEYSPPGGVIGAGIAWLFGEEPKQQMTDDLRRLKQYLETGEILRSDGSPLGMGQMIQRPARPLSNEEKGMLTA